MAADARVVIVNTTTNTVAATIPFVSATEGNPGIVVIPQALPSRPEPPADLAVVSIAGNFVTLRWQAPTSGRSPGNYIVEGGLGPGQVLGSLSVGAPVRAFAFTAPTGAFYVRVHGVNRGGRSAPSNEIRIVVNTPQTPSPPADLLAVVNGSSLALAWRNTFTGGAPTSLVLEVSGTQTLSLPLPLIDTYSVASVPPGTYTLTLRASSFGTLSSPSNSLTVTFPGACSGAPQTPVDFIADRTGNRITTLWEQPVSGPAPSSYLLNVTGAFVGSLPVSGKTLSGIVGPGTYLLSVSATNPCGTSAPTAAQLVVVP